MLLYIWFKNDAIENLEHYIKIGVKRHHADEAAGELIGRKPLDYPDDEMNGEP